LRANTLTQCVKWSDTQQHLLECEELVVSGAILDSLPDYQNMFGNELKEKIGIARIIQGNLNLERSN
jgi:hypothetical protein